MPPDEDFFLDESGVAQLRSEPRGFAPDQMIRCEECLRANPPTRTSCLYCASVLPVTAESAELRRPTLRPLEKWEKGFNSVIAPDSSVVVNDEALTAIASLLHLSSEDARRIIETSEPLPLARPATLEEAALIERKLEELGLRALTVSDEELAVVERAPKRVRSLELAEDALVAWTTGSGEQLRAAWDEIVLLVAGRIIVRQVEVQERRSRKAENEIVDTRELSSDNALLDIYTSQAQSGWRIVAGNFDFSCLGEKKDLLVAQNFVKLLEELRGRATRAAYDDSYARARHALGVVWPFEQQTESRGVKRGGPGRLRTEVVTTSDNEQQFTRYSRLRYFLKSRCTDMNT
ncbi:MAG: hypothetical protein QOF02_4174 [Blastocatellia bacterium]|nr:hypothetical protein [Blastocatellia bacterium]